MHWRMDFVRVLHACLLLRRTLHQLVTRKLPKADFLPPLELTPQVDPNGPMFSSKPLPEMLQKLARMLGSGQFATFRPKLKTHSNLDQNLPKLSKNILQHTRNKNPLSTTLDSPSKGFNLQLELRRNPRPFDPNLYSISSQLEPYLVKSNLLMA